MKKVWVSLILLVVIGGVAGGTVYAMRDTTDGFVYEQKPVQLGDVESIVNATGALEPVNTVVVGTEISGQISELMVDFNDTVEQGQVIARIDARTFEARHLQREADVQVATANIQSRKAELTRANSNLKQARRELERREELSTQGHVSVSELETDRNAVIQALTAVEIAKASVSNANAGLTQAEASLAQSSLDLERTYIRAPISGTVINRAVEIGQTVAASFSAPELFILAHDLHEMKVEASVDEADVGRLREGLSARFSVDAYPNREFRGRVSQIRKSPSENQSVVTYKVIVTARNDDLSLFPGMTANVEMVLGSRENVLTVPISALTYTPRGTSPQTADQSAGAGGSPGQGGAGGRGSSWRMTSEERAEQLAEQIGLDESQTASVVALYDSMSQRMQSIFASSAGRGGPPRGPGGGASDMRQRMQNMFNEINTDIKALLNPEQLTKFEDMLAAMSGNRQTVYVLNQLGDEEQKGVVVGLQDDNLAEVVSGLSEGDQVIVRAKRATS